VTYRSRVKLPLEGRADFTVPPEYVRDLPDQAARTEVTLPDIIGVGLLWRPIPSVDLTLDGQVVLWNVYDETVVSLQAQPSPVVSRHDYKVSGTVRLGAEWRPPVEGLAVRAGFIWDQSPAPSGVVDPSLPDAEQLDGTVGIGYRWRWIQADLGYQLAGFLPKEDTSGTIGPRGTYSTMGHFLVATLTFRLDPRAPKVAPQPDL
jgi:long-chain fatty acid transport protein